MRKVAISASGKPTLRILNACLREVVEVLYGRSGPQRPPVHFIMKPVQEEAQELLSILLTVTDTKRARYEKGEGGKLNTLYYQMDQYSLIFQ